MIWGETVDLNYAQGLKKKACQFYTASHEISNKCCKGARFFFFCPAYTFFLFLEEILTMVTVTCVSLTSCGEEIHSLCVLLSAFHFLEV